MKINRLFTVFLLNCLLFNLDAQSPWRMTEYSVGLGNTSLVQPDYQPSSSFNPTFNLGLEYYKTDSLQNQLKTLHIIMEGGFGPYFYNYTDFGSERTISNRFFVGIGASWRKQLGKKCVFSLKLVPLLYNTYDKTVNKTSRTFTFVSYTTGDTINKTITDRWNIGSGTLVHLLIAPKVQYRIRKKVLLFVQCSYMVQVLNLENYANGSKGVLNPMFGICFTEFVKKSN